MRAVKRHPIQPINPALLSGKLFVHSTTFSELYNMANPFIIAHRGESFDAPENTLTAINLAWNRGAFAVEIDVHLTVDNQVIVIHDYNTHRISGIKKVIKKTTLDELRKLDAGLFKGEQFAGEKFPTLAEVLQTVPENGRIIIEIKSDQKILPFLNEVIADSGLQDHQVEMIAFNFRTLKKAKVLMPQYKMLWLLNLDYYLPAWLCRVNKSGIAAKLKKHRLDGIDVFSGKLLTEEFIQYFKQQNFLVYTWTEDNPKVAETLINHGINGITTNRANWLGLQLKHLT